jgi:beta-N-acetylhexosaminidase
VRGRAAVAVLVAVAGVSACGPAVTPAGQVAPSVTGTTANPSVPPVPPPVSPPPSHPAPTPTPTGCPLPVQKWSAWQLAGAVIMAPAQLGHLSTAQPMVAAGVGGVVLFGSPVGDVRAQLRQLHAAAGAWPLLVASDEEGGGIQRLAALTGALPWPRDLAARGPDGIRSAARAMGQRLRALTVRIDLAPVADLDAGPGPDAAHPDGKRSFSADPATATADVLAFARGLLDAGIVPVVKHYPGLGTASANTDAATGVTASLPALERRDLLPFVAAVHAGLPAVMTSNAVVPGLSSLPVSVSTAATRLLRQQLGFRGAIITDSLSASALTAAGFTVNSAAVQALTAGADAVILGRGDTQDATALVASVRGSIVAAVDAGRLPIARLREAVRRLAQLMGSTTC